MARSINKLSDAQLKAWVAAGKPLAVSDGGGLTFTLAASGYAAWIFRYRHGGRQKELTFGHYPTVKLQRAREMAATARADVLAFKDVARIKQDEKQKITGLTTFRQLTKDYEQKALVKLSKSTQQQRQHYIDSHILKDLGSIPVKEVTTDHVATLLRKLAKKKTANVVEGVLTAISQIFVHGGKGGIVSINPCKPLGISAIVGDRPPTRQRVMLSEEELRELLPNLSKIGLQNALTVKILLSTCCRIGELARAKWTDVDFENSTWTIPIENSKTSKAFVIPLPERTASWFRELQPLSLNSAFVLPARQTRREKTHGEPMHYEQRALNSMLHKLTPKLNKVRRFTPHDLRATARSHLAALGVDDVIAERCLNHSLGGLLKIYNKYDYFAERQLALEVWTSFIVACESGKIWKIPKQLTLQSPLRKMSKGVSPTARRQTFHAI